MPQRPRRPDCRSRYRAHRSRCRPRRETQRDRRSHADERRQEAIEGEHPTDAAHDVLRQPTERPAAIGCATIGVVGRGAWRALSRRSPGCLLQRAAAPKPELLATRQGLPHREAMNDPGTRRGVPARRLPAATSFSSHVPQRVVQGHPAAHSTQFWRITRHTSTPVEAHTADSPALSRSRHLSRVGSPCRSKDDIAVCHLAPAPASRPPELTCTPRCTARSLPRCC